MHQRGSVRQAALALAINPPKNPVTPPPTGEQILTALAGADYDTGSTTERRIRARFVQLAEDPFDPRLSSPLTGRDGSASPASAAGGSCARTLIVATVDTRGQA